MNKALNPKLIALSGALCSFLTLFALIKSDSPFWLKAFTSFAVLIIAIYSARSWLDYKNSTAHQKVPEKKHQIILMLLIVMGVSVALFLLFFKYKT
jgi:uncharacterized membrane protein YfcA